MNSSDVFQIVFCSKATVHVAEQDLLQIQRAASRHNRELGVSGVLLYGRGMFIQLLEGPRASVQATLEHIRRDLRHSRVQVIHESFAAERAYQSWSMGAVSWEPHSDIIAQTDFIESIVTNKPEYQQMGIVQAMLLEFERCVTEVA